MQYAELTLQQRAIGAYLGLAVGDALGATTEFLIPREIQEKHGTHRKICGGGWLYLKPGQVTDDTEMSLALGESILKRQGVEAESVAQAFSGWMRTKPVDIGNTVRRGIIHFRTTGEPFVQENEYDAGNGACMRSLPVALFYWNASTAVLMDASRTQSHVNRGGDADTTGAIAGMLAGACYGKAKIPRQWLKSLNPDIRKACEKQSMELLSLADRRI